MATQIEQRGVWCSALVVPNAFPVLECSTAAAWIDLAADRERLARERDESRAACHRLQYEVQALRAQLATRQAEMVRARQTAERLKAFRGECERLYAAHAGMSREATRQESRLVEIQVTLVAVEAELEEQRERRQAERYAWQAERQRLLAETERIRAEDQAQLEAERQNRLQEQALHRRAAREAERLQEKVNRLRRHGARTRQQRDDALRQVEGLAEKLETLNERCARLSAYLDEAETENRVSRETHQAEIRRLHEALDEALAEAESALQRESSHIAQIHALESQRGEPRQEDRVSQ